MYDLVVRAGTLDGPMTSERGGLVVRIEPTAPVGSRRVDGVPFLPIDPTGFVVIPGGVAPECRYNIRCGQVVTEPHQSSPGAIRPSSANRSDLRVCSSLGPPVA